MNAWVARNLLYRPATWLRGEPVFRLLRHYQSSQWWTPQQLSAYQENALNALLRYAATHTRHYSRVFQEAGLEPDRISASDLGQLPILTKADLVENIKDLQAPRPPGTTSWKTTSGSTGAPVRLRKNRRATAAEQAASWRSYSWYGIRPGHRQARFWGTPLREASRIRHRVIDWVLNRHRFSAFAFDRRQLHAYFDVLNSARPTWVYGYVSMLTQFANFCMEEQLPLAKLDIRAVVTTSEVLSATSRATIGSAFGAPVFNEYGCGEVGAVLYECERGRLHLMAENLFVEPVPDPTPERPGAVRLLVTDLHNQATPLLRYDLGDRVVPAPACPCGRGLPAFVEVFGRAYDFVEAADGSRFHGEFFMYILEEACEEGVPIRQAQFIQREPDYFEIRIVAGPDYREIHGDKLAERLATRSHGRFRAGWELVEKLEREPSGKLRLVRALS